MPEFTITVTEDQRTTLVNALRNRQTLLYRVMETYSMQGNKPAVQDCLNEIRKTKDLTETLKTAKPNE